MRRTSSLTLVVIALAAAAAGFLVDHALTVAGAATFTPVTGLPVLLLLLSGAVLVLAWPVRRSVRPGAAARMDPFRALRIATLARASSLLGAGVAGFALGLLGFLLTRPVGPQVGSVLAIAAAGGSALVLVCAALVAERFCMLPPDGGSHDERQAHDDDESPGAARR